MKNCTRSFDIDLERKVDLFLFRLPENSPWFHFETSQRPDVWRYAVEYWHKIGVLSFSISADGSKYKKDFNVDNDFINSYLKEVE